MADNNALFREMLKRAVAEHADMVDPVKRPAAPSAGPSISPETLATIGGLADAGSTYSFLKSGQRTEANPLLAGLHNAPLPTALGVVGVTAANRLLRELLRKKFPRLADMMAANQGRDQLGIAAANMNVGNTREGSTDQLKEAIDRATQERQRRGY